MPKSKNKRKSKKSELLKRHYAKHGKPRDTSKDKGPVKAMLDNLWLQSLASARL